MNEAALLAALAIVATISGALVWIIKYLFNTFKPVMDELVRATQANTSATISADTYLKQRNGRDIDFHTEIMEKLKAIPDQAAIQAERVAIELKRVGDLTAQKVAEVKEEVSHPTTQQQTVIKQTVEEQVINK